jgi:hypothetical protein
MTSLNSLYVITEDCQLAVSILTGLKRSDCRLKELNLCCRHSHAYWVALSEFTHATTFLKHLRISEHKFDEDDMAAFLGCLEGQPTIFKLSLFDCSMDSAAVRLLKRFMGKRKEIDTLGVSSLQELVWESVRVGVAWMSVPVPMFWMKQTDGPNKAWYSTIGSHIRSLTLDECSGFVSALARHAHRFNLTSLSLCNLDAEDCKQLARYISITRLLKKLELHEDGDEDGDENDDTDCFYPVLCSLEINGSLHTVTIPGETRS